MILGVGVDVHDVRDIDRRLTEAGFMDRFTDRERAMCDNRFERSQCYTKRFVAKEACIKALGSNDALGNVEFYDIEVILTKSGRPTLALSGGAHDQLYEITPAGMVPKVIVSISDYFPMAVAIVTIHAYSP